MLLRSLVRGESGGMGCLDACGGAMLWWRLPSWWNLDEDEEVGRKKEHRVCGGDVAHWNGLQRFLSRRGRGIYTLQNHENSIYAHKN